MSVKGLFRLLTCIHVLDFLAMSTDSGWGYSIGTEEGDLYTSQCCSGPAKVCSLITPAPAHHVINRADGGKQSWVFQCDGKPAVIQQPVTDTMWIQRHLAQSVVTRTNLAQTIKQSVLRMRQGLHWRRYTGKAGWRTGRRTCRRTWERQSTAVPLSVFAAHLSHWTGCWTVGRTLSATSG